MQLQNPAGDRTQGLGLAIVRRTAALLRHPLKLVSVTCRGSMFSVMLPRAGAVETPLLDNRASPVGTTVSIMVVEDERDLDIMVQLLTLQGHRVYAGQSAAEVQRIHAEAMLAGDTLLDLIIADYRLGDGATGVEAIEALCAHIDRSVPAVIVTGDTSPSRIKEATASGHRILHKPITSEELHEAIVAACVDGKEAINSGC